MGDGPMQWAGEIVGRVTGVLQRWAERDLSGILEDVGEARAPEGGGAGVEIVFHTYWGLLGHVVEREHRYRLEPALARRLLRRLHYYNVRHGFFTWYAPVLALNSRLNYIRQLREVGRQVGETQ